MEIKYITHLKGDMVINKKYIQLIKVKSPLTFNP